MILQHLLDYRSCRVWSVVPLHYHDMHVASFIQVRLKHLVVGANWSLFFRPLLCSSKLLWEMRQEAAACMGLLCGAISYEAERIFKWLFLKFSGCSRDDVKLLYLIAAHRGLEAAGERKAFSPVMQVTETLSKLVKGLKEFTILAYCTGFSGVQVPLEYWSLLSKNVSLREKKLASRFHV